MHSSATKPLITEQAGIQYIHSFIPLYSVYVSWYNIIKYCFKVISESIAVEPPFNSQNDRVYAPVDNTKRHQSQPTATHVGMASIAVSPVGMTEVIFVNHEVKVNGQHYCDVLLSQQMLSAIKRVAERCLFTKQYVAYGEIGHFLCSVISQGKVVALDG